MLLIFFNLTLFTSAKKACIFSEEMLMEGLPVFLALIADFGRGGALIGFIGASTGVGRFFRAARA